MSIKYKKIDRYFPEKSQRCYAQTISLNKQPLKWLSSTNRTQHANANWANPANRLNPPCAPQPAAPVVLLIYNPLQQWHPCLHLRDSCMCFAIRIVDTRMRGMSCWCSFNSAISKPGKLGFWLVYVYDEFYQNAMCGSVYVCSDFTRQRDLKASWAKVYAPYNSDTILMPCSFCVCMERLQSIAQSQGKVKEIWRYREGEVDR